MAKLCTWKPPLIREFLEKADESKRWIVPDFVANEGLSLISGPRKLARKTWLADLLALVITEGVEVDKLRCIDPGPVIYFEEEGTPMGTKIRWESFEFTYGFNLRESKNLYYVFRPRLLLDDADWSHRIVSAVKDIKPRAVIFDALTYMHKADENKTHEMRAVVDTLQNIRAAGTACIFLAHTNSQGSSDTSLDIDQGVRGSKVILDCYDVHVGLRRQCFEDPEIRCQIRQREGSERIYSLKWDLISEWDPVLEAEDIHYVYPHFVSDDDLEIDKQLEMLLDMTDFKKACSCKVLATKARMRTDRVQFLLTRLMQTGEIEAIRGAAGALYRRLK